jgi:23S rRNA U2552 (ribose-2'-O)-methylase RlmE/FtsJ
MTYYLIPRVNININANDINIKFRNESEYNNFLSMTLSKYLNNVKLRINKYPVVWDTFKRITNSYEYIHTTLPNSKNSVSKIKPLSRAFFKLIEIYNKFDMFKDVTTPIKSFHLAEGPGGFIEAMTHLRCNEEDRYHGITLIDSENENIPGWNKSALFLRKNRCVVIEKGADNTGNLYSPENFKFCNDSYKGSMDFITADGGFDFSVDFNKQEAMALRLIFTEVVYAISMQKYNGTFVLKMFDTFLKSSLDIIFLLSTLYEKVYIVKPNTSRSANSERYIVCFGYKLHNADHLFNKLYDILITLNNSLIDEMTILSVIDIQFPYKFKCAMEEINAVIGSQQIDNIQTTLRFIENKERKGEKIQQIKNNNIQKCITWCIKNKIPYNKTGSTGNIFMMNKMSIKN